jgi:hypothetical protein
MKKKFLNQVKPKIYESLYSFLYRTATANHFDHLGSVLKEIGPTIYCLNCNYIDINKNWNNTLMGLIQMTNTDHERLTLNQFDDLLMLEDTLGKQQERFLYHHSNSKYCPECLSENAYHKIFWDVRFVTTCLKHQKYLMEKCPICLKNSRTSRIMQDKCTCGHRFSEYENSDAIPSPIEIRAQECIQSLLLGEQASVNIDSNEILTKVEYFNFFILFCHIVDNLKISGLYDLTNGHTKFNYGMKNNEKKNVSSANVLATFVHLLITKPKQFLLPVLQRLEDEAEVNKHTKKIKFSLFHKIINDNSGKLYEEIYKQSLMNSTNVYINRKQHVKITVEEKQYLTFEEVINHYQIPLKRLKFLCNKGTLSVVSDSDTRLIEKESIEKYLQVTSQSLNKHQAAKFIGVSTERIIDLSLNGKLKALHGPKVDGNYFWSFQRQDLEQTLEWICSNCQIVDKKIDGYIPFEKANYAVRHLNIDTLTIIDMVAKGEFPSIILKDEPNIKGIYILERAIIDLCKVEREKRIENWGYTLLESSHILNIDVRKIKKWVQDGKVKTNFTINNQNGTTSIYLEKRLIENMDKICNH